MAATVSWDAVRDLAGFRAAKGAAVSFYLDLDPSRTPTEGDAATRVSSLLADAPKLARPLLLIHGLADDNVAVAHTLRLSSALLAAGRPHNVLPLSGVTHMASQEEVAENLLLLQVDFLRTALGIEARTDTDA